MRIDDLRRGMQVVAKASFMAEDKNDENPIPVAKGDILKYEIKAFGLSVFTREGTSWFIYVREKDVVAFLKPLKRKRRFPWF